ncbi:DUF58 domain-containing protein [Polyangium sp. 15x6]|uniref:DUF58 domain-containing protein n=1 Tax=Polyangium sp. 15x6 TaxID=3042687 RepID=UPI00249B1851|nr:DUF58 domain-containing protein [Polyangium sp. 15x6]MDI3283988.1 DUF58 domain-containing protein [Polyangium sp. 15x6]
MQLFPTRTAAHLSIAAISVAGVGLVAREPAIVGWGGAMLLAMALARAVTLVSVSRIRAAGFEMLWSGPRRVVRTGRGSTIEIEAEVRNRDTLAARYVRLRPIASSQLQITIEPSAGEVMASGRLKVKVSVHAPRVGQHGVHGLALEVHGAPGLFEVPLTFANPFGVEVLPRPFAAWLPSPRGGRSKLLASSGRPGRARGEGSDMRELREHQPGDPFRRIAWKASARRGILLVRDFEREERDVVWVVLDASVELWAGPLGRAPLDLAIDEAASICARYLSRGDRVGLAIYASTVRAFVLPDQGPAHGQKLAHLLVTATGTHDASRSDLDEADVAVRVLEHLRPLDARGLSDLRRGDLDRLASRADAVRPRAPFAPPPPDGRSPRERTLRRYLAAYGIESPARAEAERHESGFMLAEVLSQIVKSKPKPSVVHVVAPAPSEIAQEKPVMDALRRLARHSASVTWSMPQFDPGLLPPWDPPTRADGSPSEEVAEGPRRIAWEEAAGVAAEAVLVRTRVAVSRSEAVLRRLGVRVTKIRATTTKRPDAADPKAT